MTTQELDLLTSMEKAFPGESTEVLLLRKLVSLGGSGGGSGGGNTANLELCCARQVDLLITGNTNTTSIDAHLKSIEVNTGKIDTKIRELSNFLMNERDSTLLSNIKFKTFSGSSDLDCRTQMESWLNTSGSSEYILQFKGGSFMYVPAFSHYDLLIFYSQIPV